ncbi:hypothetical protein [Actinosynnema sp. NPDC020468]|uniref:hypothetical protein n=1 Tax=Actinosynnema sp. NPDC020468 TaxID=3154488 RepID=UPI0033E1520B
MTSEAVAERRLHAVPDLPDEPSRSPLLTRVLPILAGVVVLVVLLRRRRNR